MHQNEELSVALTLTFHFELLLDLILTSKNLIGAPNNNNNNNNHSLKENCKDYLLNDSKVNTYYPLKTPLSQ